MSDITKLSINGTSYDIKDDTKVLISSVSANNPTLSHGITSTIGSVGGVTFKVTAPPTPTTAYVASSGTNVIRYLVATSSTGTGQTYLYNYTNIYVNHSTGVLTATSFNSTSDARLKENITDYECDSSILDLPVYKYDFIDGAKNQIGCLAQDLQKICPELVTEDDNSYLKIAESKIVYLLLQELKSQNKRIENLEKTLSETEK